MFISHKSNVLQQVHETEWQCRRLTKGLTKPEYWEWIATITSGDPPVVDYSGETGYTIVECTDEDVQARLVQLSDYISIDSVYNIKWSNDIGDAEEILGEDGKSQSPKVYVQSHFKGDDSAKDARLLTEEWTRIRRERTKRLAETDWVVIKARENGGTVPAKWKTYRVALRDLPAEQSAKTKYSDITWPTQPS